MIADDGVERGADAMVLGNRVQSHGFLAPMEVRGSDGRELSDVWRGGANAYLGMAVAGFPNLFVMYGPNTNLGAGSIITQLESQIAYIVDAVQRLRRTGGWLSVKPEVQESFDRTIQDRLSDSVWLTGCSNWYVDEHGRDTNNWPGFTLEYRWLTRRLDPADYEESAQHLAACSRARRSARGGARRGRGRASPSPARRRSRRPRGQPPRGRVPRRSGWPRPPRAG